MGESRMLTAQGCGDPQDGDGCTIDAGDHIGASVSRKGYGIVRAQTDQVEKDQMNNMTEGVYHRWEIALLKGFMQLGKKDTVGRMSVVATKIPRR